MFKIDLLKNHPDAIPALANIWYEVLGKIWFPELTIQQTESLTIEFFYNMLDVLFALFSLNST